MKTLTVCASAVCGAWLAGATTVITVHDGIDDWTNPENFDSPDGKTIPGPGIEVVLPDGYTVYINDRTSMDQLCGCVRISPMSESSRLMITVPAGEVWTNRCPMSAQNLSKQSDVDCAKGQLVKRGEGVLWLDADGHHWAAGAALFDWWTQLIVEAGELHMPKNEDDGNQYAGYVSVSNGASFFVVEEGCNTFVRGIFGDGVITNASGTSHSFVEMGKKNLNWDSDYAGSIGGNLNLKMDKNGTRRLYGANSSFKGTVVVNGGTVGIGRFGEKTNSVSTIGNAGVITCNSDDNLRVVYLGTGEQTDKDLSVKNDSNFIMTLDGGVAGGLVWKGEIRPTASSGTMREFVFDGEGREECVMAGGMLGNYKTGASSYDGFYYAKAGAGAWRFTEHWQRMFPSGFAIREGTLRFDSLHERGQLCSIGLATNLTAGAGNAYAQQVAYAYKMGTADNGKAAAVFEYTGTNSAQCSTRPIVLEGDGHIRNNTPRRIRFAGVSALSAGKAVKTLVLDGSGCNTNEIADIADGLGKMAVTKAGTGTWVLSGDQTFTGPLKVESGRLIVRKTVPGKFTWFRWTIKDKQTNAKGEYSSLMSISQFALMDDQGYFQSANLVKNDYYAELEPGEFGFQTDYGYVVTSPATGQDGQAYRMFITENRKNNYGFNANFYQPCNTTEAVQVESKPETRLPIVMRLSEDSRQVASFDYMNVFADANPNTNTRRNIGRSSLEGSVDGLHWVMLADNIASPSPTTASWTWSMSGKAEGSAVSLEQPHMGGGALPVSSTEKSYRLLDGVETISVSPGAELIADGEVTISRLTIDAAGSGTFNGFEFASENGMIAFTNVPKGEVSIPASFVNTRNQTLSNIASWSFTIDGKQKNYTMSVSESGIVLKPGGLMLIVR